MTFPVVYAATKIGDFVALPNVLIQTGNLFHDGAAKAWEQSC